MGASIPAEVLREYGEAVARERFERVAAFLDLPERICGLPVVPLTIRHLVLLESIGSPFAVGGVPSADDIVNVLWILNPKFTPSKLDKRWFYLRRCRKLGYKSALESLARYFREAFADVAGGGSKRKQYCSSAASLIDALASEYGWSESQILSLPIKRALQYINASMARKYPKAALCNPSDDVLGRWLHSLDKTTAN